MHAILKPTEDFYETFYQKENNYIWYRYFMAAMYIRDRTHLIIVRAKTTTSRFTWRKC